MINSRWVGKCYFISQSGRGHIFLVQPHLPPYAHVQELHPSREGATSPTVYLVSPMKHEFFNKKKRQIECLIVICKNVFTQNIPYSERHSAKTMIKGEQ